MKVKSAIFAKLSALALAGAFCGSYFVVCEASVTAIGEPSGTARHGPADIYEASCAKCHGSDGRARTSKGKRAGATDFTGTDWNTDEARGIRIITNGKGQMPSFKSKLTAAEIKSVFGYVLSFRH